jgi:hypothetical protein
MNTRPDTLGLNDLARLSGAQLAQRYTVGTTPSDLRTLNGDPRGRMLAVRTLDSGLARSTLARIAGARRFVWGGKSLRATTADQGRGINRVRLGGRHALFPFVTRIGPSAVDGEPCVVLDYDLPDNPAFIRRIHDEVREVHPGLFLGPAMWKTAAEPVHVLWFALDTRVSAEPLCLI